MRPIFISNNNRLPPIVAYDYRFVCGEAGDLSLREEERVCVMPRMREAPVRRGKAAAS